VLAVLCFGFVGALYLRGDPRGDRHLVVLYYANETSLAASNSPNYKAILGALRRANNAAGATIARTIESDSAVFRSVVIKDEADLFHAAKDVGFDLAFFDNSKTLEGYYLSYMRHTGAVEKRQLATLPPAQNAILEMSPLSRPEALSAAIAGVAALYPEKALDIVLITFTHGSADMAIIPRVSTNLTAPDAQREFLQQLSGSGQVHAPAWAAVQGISKREYWRVIAEASARWGVMFPVVFRQSCASGVDSWSEYRALPSSVGYVAHSGTQNMKLRQIDYRAVFSRFNPSGSWLEAFKSRIRQSGVQVQSKQSIWIGPAMISIASVNPLYFFVPLMIWLGWLGMVFVQHRRAVP
jgi:hypothetical protein